ncbi:hypothetical protein L1987_04377 [Smallanthus sonchifolius]|uniref:Uncharacterized protein n=1 Tax=Smallanthus sonchifolius TaxID=185202 RepID=A0ACB9KD74_9ASTR|nr:hypothetical protein L1987_04377 [Smallanthus sonchifolius]
MAYVDHAFSISDEDIMMESDSVYTEDEKSDGESDNVVLTVDLTLMQARLHAYTALSLKRSIEWIAASDLEDESAKLILGWKGANSTEFDEHAPNPVVIFMPEGSRTHMGNTMRLGSRRTLLQTSDCIKIQSMWMSDIDIVITYEVLIGEEM